MIKTTQHTPVPWTISIHSNRDILAPNGEILALTYPMGFNADWDSKEFLEGEHNAALIVKAVNCHAVLVEALNNLLLCVEGMDQDTLDSDFENSRDAARAALNQAEGSE